MNKVLNLLFTIFIVSSCSSPPTRSDAPNLKSDAKQPIKSSESLIEPGEFHFSELRQLTYRGINTLPKFNAQGTEVIFQAIRQGFECSQVFKMDRDGKNIQLISSGLASATDGHFFPHTPKIIYSSTQGSQKHCPTQSVSGESFHQASDVWVATADGTNPTRLAPKTGADFPSAVSPNGDTLLFTSLRNGDIDVWMMAPDGTNTKQLTKEVGYDGEASFSADASKIVYSANHPNDEKGLESYRKGLETDGLEFVSTDLFIMNSDGSDKTDILSNGFQNRSPAFHPDGKRIIFSSNMDDPERKHFSLYLIDIDGTKLERVSFGRSIDSSPQFSRDGKSLTFSSDRGATRNNHRNIFVADWTDQKQKKVRLPRESNERWITHAKIISSKEMGGRGIGTKGLKSAQKYIEKQLVAMGYDVVRQSFPVDVAESVAQSRLVISSDETSLAATKNDVSPFSFSGDGNVKGPLIFAGQGVLDKGRDDYKGLEVEGKTVIVFNPRRAHKYLAISAQQHGASAIIIVNSPDAKIDKVADFEVVRGGVNIPAMSMTWAFASKAFPNLIAIHESANRGIVKSVDGNFKVELETKIKRKEIGATNILTTLKGKDKKKGSIIVGAHFDHLGFGGEGSMSPHEKVIHPGADDNASGVATVLELANQIKHLEGKFERDIVFVLFSGEESGLLGSNHFVSDPTKMAKVKFMINFDMIGRMKERKLHLLGSGTATGLVDTIRRSQVDLGLDLILSSDGYGPSDQSSFFAKKVPVLHFFTGLHEDYHRPSDTAEKLNIEGANRIGTLALRILIELVDKKEISFATQDGRNEVKPIHQKMGAYFGSIPAAKKQPSKGVLLAGARPGSPAALAGIKEGDIIIRFGKYETATMKDYAAAIRNYQAEDLVEVVVDRNGVELKLKARLKKKL